MADYPAHEVRVAGVEDASSIARLNLVFNGCDEAAERYAARLADPHRVDTPILALIAGRAAGIANLRLLVPVFYPEPYAELTELYVEESGRRQGIGQALVRFAEQLARQGGAVELFILTGAGNLPAQDFYRAIGYRADEVAFSKSLKSALFPPPPPPPPPAPPPPSPSLFPFSPPPFSLSLSFRSPSLSLSLSLFLPPSSFLLSLPLSLSLSFFSFLSLLPFFSFLSLFLLTSLIDACARA